MPYPKKTDCPLVFGPHRPGQDAHVDRPGRVGRGDGDELRVRQDRDRRRLHGPEQDVQLAGRPGEVLAGDRDRVPPALDPELTLRPVTRGVRSTTSKSVARIDWTCSTASMSHWSDGVPWKNMSDPLSATISP